MKKIEDMSARELACIIGEETRCALATREELGKSVNYVFRVIKNVSKNQRKKQS